MLLSAIAKRLSLDLEGLKKTVSVAERRRSWLEGKTSKVPVMLDSLDVKMIFIVMQSVPFDLVIGRLTLKRLGGVLDFRAEEVHLDYKGQQETLPMVSE